MNKKRIAISTLAGYLGIMMVCFVLSNMILQLLGRGIVNGMDVDSTNVIIKFIAQIPPTTFLIYCINKYYKWDEIGFSKLNKKGLVWFIPYFIVISIMIIKFILGISKEINFISLNTYLVLTLTLLGTIIAGFSEEVIFRGIFLNSFKANGKIIIPMIISSLGFSIGHITTILTGISIFNVLGRIVYSSLMGFSFVGLAIKMKNIWPITIFHIIWNFIILASNNLSIEISNIANLVGLIDLLMAIILWSTIIINDKKEKRISLKEKNLVANIKYMF